MKIRLGSLLVLMLAIGWSQAGAQSAARRVLVEVKDAGGKPLEKVKVTITSPERSGFRKTYATDAKGRSGFLLPVEIKTADFLLEKGDYQDHRETISLKSVQSSKEDLSYTIPFVLYLLTEQTPDQRRKAEAVNEKALASFNRGIALFNTGQFADAIGQFEGAVEAKPDFLEALENLAASYFRVERYEKAVEAALKAEEIDARSVQMIKLLSVAYSRLGNEDKALEYEEKLKGFPDTELSAEELYNLGVVEANKGNDAEAAKYLEKAALAKPDLALAHYHLGLCRFRLNDPSGARTELERYLSLEPDGENAKTARAILATLK